MFSLKKTSFTETPLSSSCSFRSVHSLSFLFCPRYHAIFWNIFLTHMLLLFRFFESVPPSFHSFCPSAWFHKQLGAPPLQDFYCEIPEGETTEGQANWPLDYWHRTATDGRVMKGHHRQSSQVRDDAIIAPWLQVLQSPFKLRAWAGRQPSGNACGYTIVDFIFVVKITVDKYNSIINILLRTQTI